MTTVIIAVSVYLALVAAGLFVAIRMVKANG